jgi:hypothetical protein
MPEYLKLDSKDRKTILRLALIIKKNPSANKGISVKDSF